MDTAYTLLIFGGPVLSAFAFIACLIPRIRPQRLPWTLGALGLCSSLPVGAAMITNSGYPLLILGPATVFLGLLAAVSYFVISRRHRLPLRQSVAAIALLIGSAWNGTALFIISRPGFGGAYCQQTPTHHESRFGFSGLSQTPRLR